MSSQTMRLGLFDPGMTHLHRVGLAGLYMTLKSLHKSKHEEFGDWTLEPHCMTLQWKKTPRDFLVPIIRDAFGINSSGAIDFHAHKAHGMGDLKRLMLHKAVLLTFLQHGRTRTLAKQTRSVSCEFGDITVSESIKVLERYVNQEAEKKAKMFDSKGQFKEKIELAGWAFPGGAVRHTAFSGDTSLTGTPAQFLALLFAPVGSLYFLITHRERDGGYDKRKVAAIVLPHVQDLETYHRCYFRYLDAPVQRTYANSSGDAGLVALTTLNILDSQEGMIRSLDIGSCSVILFGTVGWAKQQKTRTAVLTIRDIDDMKLNRFCLALRILDNQVQIKEGDSFHVRPSQARGLIAENIALGREWFHDFRRLMVSRELARSIRYERGGLNEMVQHDMSWSHEADRLLVDAVHKALRNRYGALASRAKQKGEAVNFDREFERIRTSLMRAKNAQTLRAEIADIFARGGLNKTLQERWADVLPLFNGSDWQRVRDLSLLALVSYSGQGAELNGTRMDETTNDEDEEE